MLTSLFEPVRLGELELGNRILMAAMTRSRADSAGCVTDLHVQYYGQRAEAGLIITEGAFPSEDGKGYCRTPGLATPAQINAWQRVTDEVHRHGGRIVVQLMHVGRIATHHNKAPGAQTVAPSAVRAETSLYSDDAGYAMCDPPRMLDLDAIPQVIEDYRAAALNARRAGFDGVELHASSGYLPMQFLLACTNRRDDAYGGSLSRRTRFIVELLEVMSGAIGAGRVGLRICPDNPYNDVRDDDATATYGALLDAVSPLRLAYLQVSRSPNPALDAFALARRHFHGPLVINDGFDGPTAGQALRAGTGDAVSFGRHFIANPDLVRRLCEGAPLATFDRARLYTPGPRGYTDYPALPLSAGLKRPPATPSFRWR